MTEFKVGDRVIYNADGDKGTIKSFEEHRIWVSWDNARGAEAWVGEHEISKFSSYGSHAQDNFSENVRRITAEIADLLIEKNAAYGDSALNPIRVFSKSDRIEQLNVRIDDKISRIQRGSEYGDEDTEMDLCGYLILKMIARESA